MEFNAFHALFFVVVYSTFSVLLLLLYSVFLLTLVFVCVSIFFFPFSLSSWFKKKKNEKEKNFFHSPILIFIPGMWSNCALPQIGDQNDKIVRPLRTKQMNNREWASSIKPENKKNRNNRTLKKMKRSEIQARANNWNAQNILNVFFSCFMNQNLKTD